MNWLCVIALVALATVVTVTESCTEATITNHTLIKSDPVTGSLLDICHVWLTGGRTMKKCYGTCTATVRFDGKVGSSSSSIADPDTDCMAKLNCCNPTTLTTSTGVTEHCFFAGTTTTDPNRKLTYPSSCECKPCYGTSVTSGVTAETHESIVTTDHCT